MAATPVYALPYPASADPADVPADIGALANRIETAIAPGTGNGQVPIWDHTAKKWRPQGGAMSATPPASPLDGEMWYWPHPLAGIWAFRYVAAMGDAMKWCFVGGPPLVSDIYGSETVTSSAPVNLATPGPTVTVPRAGVYLVEASVMTQNSVVPANSNIFMWLYPENTQQEYCSVRHTTANVPVTVAMLHGPITCQAGGLLQMKYAIVGGGTATFLNRHMRVIPVRVS